MPHHPENAALTTVIGVLLRLRLTCDLLNFSGLDPKHSAHSLAEIQKSAYILSLYPR